MSDESVDLGQLKLAEEIKTIRMQQRNDRVRLFLDLVKAVAIAFAAITAFMVLQRPESLLNRAASKESIARERAKLLLESLKETDASKRLDSLRIIRVAYGSDDAAWLGSMEQVLKEKVEDDRMLSRLAQIDLLRGRRERLQRELLNELAGKGISHYPGMDPVAQQLRHEITSLEMEIYRLTSELRPPDTASQPKK